MSCTALDLVLAAHIARADRLQGVLTLDMHNKRDRGGKRGKGDREAG